MTSSPRYLVLYDPDAVVDLEGLKSRAERKTTFTAIDKLRWLVPDLPMPHAKSLKGEPDLWEIRPRGGASQVRPVYMRRGGDGFIVLAFAIEADKSDFDKAVRAARTRMARYRD